jgi:hypothetical protein
MRARHVVLAVSQNIRRNRRAFLLSSVGLVVGVSTLVFFVQLGLGIQQGVLNRIYPVNQLEFEPRTVSVLGLRQDVLDASRLDDALVNEFRALPGVLAVYPKQRSRFQARLEGGRALFGYPARTEAFFDGLAPDLVASELKAREAETATPTARPRRGDGDPCLADSDCRLGFTCDRIAGSAEGDPGRCAPERFRDRFRRGGIVAICERDDQCPGGEACADGLCAPACGADAAPCADGTRCTAQAAGARGTCQRPCEAASDCGPLATCGTAPDGARRCEPLRCQLPEPASQLVDSPLVLGGEVTSRCANGVAPSDPGCVRAACPSGTYCAAASLIAREGFCERPIPVLLSPFIVEVFNSSVASSLGMQKIDGPRAMLGFDFTMHFGNSYFAADLPAAEQVVKRAEIVGFSEKALEFGVTMPLDWVRALNARLKGRAAAGSYDTVIVETAGNEDVSPLISRFEARGFTLARRSADARKAGDLLFILTLVFSFISVVILFVAGVNIANAFLTLVTERRHEIGIMRAIGATRGDIARLFMAESLALGLAGGLVGNALAFGAARAVNAVAQAYLAELPFRPDDFFATDWRVIAGGVAFACVFCLLGAAFPARRAARLDPAAVLAS